MEEERKEARESEGWEWEGGQRVAGGEGEMVSEVRRKGGREVDKCFNQFGIQDLTYLQ